MAPQYLHKTHLNNENAHCVRRFAYFYRYSSGKAAITRSTYHHIWGIIIKSPSFKVFVGDAFSPTTIETGSTALYLACNIMSR